MPEARRDPWLRLWVERCQCLAGHLDDTAPLAVLTEIRWLYADLPSAAGIVDQWLTRGLLGTLVSRLLRVHRVDSRPDLSHAFFAFAASGLSVQQWRREFERLLDRCDVVLGAETTSRLAHVQVQRALCAIQGHYTDPRLNLDTIAREVGLSAPHLSRLLTIHTGHGFLTHLHHRRSSAAHRLLLESDLTPKEIAAAVGYRSVTQLGRRFKLYCGSTPASIRALRPIATKRAS